MTLSDQEKTEIKRLIGEALSREPEVRRVVVFGSFLSDPGPHDVDVAVFQDSAENYLTLALRYRRDVRSVSRRLPVDVVPLKANDSKDPFLVEIEKGETVYER